MEKQNGSATTSFLNAPWFVKNGNDVFLIIIFKVLMLIYKYIQKIIIIRDFNI